MDPKLIQTILILSPMFVNYVLLFNRKKKWVRNEYKWYVVFVISLSSFLLYFIGFEHKTNYDFLVHYAFVTPLIISILEFLFRKLSYAIHKRDFYLWLRGSSEIDDTQFSGGKKVRNSDRLISLILIFSVIFLPIVPLLIVGK